MKNKKQYHYWSYLVLIILLLTNQPFAWSQQNNSSQLTLRTIHILSPRDGIVPTIWQLGSVQVIRWKGNSASNVKIELFRGQSLVETISASTANDGSHAYWVNPNLPTASNYRIKVTDVSNAQVFGWSDLVTITSLSGNIVVHNPTTGTVWRKGKTYPIEWTDNISGPVRIELFINGVFQLEISPSTASDGHYNYTVPINLPTSSLYEIRISDVNDVNVFGWSSKFAIYDPIPNSGFITINQPTSSTLWNKGLNYSIRWSSGNIIGNVKIELFRGGALVDVIASDTTNDGIHRYDVPMHLSTADNYYVRISSVLDPNIFDISDDFMVHTVNPDPRSFIRVSEPETGDVWIRGQTYAIVWEDNLVEDVFIQIRLGGILLYNLGTTESDGLYLFTVPQNAPFSSIYKIRISSAVHPIVMGESGVFSITGSNQSTITVPNTINSEHSLTTIETLSLVPNPQRKGQASALMVESREQGQAKLRVVDLTGKVLVEQSIDLIKGKNQLTLDALPHTGWYTVVVETATSQKSKTILVQE